jgi:lipid A ethanolaminephosphotransferase
VSKTLQVFPFVDNAYFIISLIVVVVLLFNITINLLNLFIPLRPLLSLFLLIGAVTNYFASNFGTIFNDVMIINVMETSLDESLDIININFTLNLLFLGLLPSLLLYRIAIVNNTHLQNAGRILVATLLSTLIISGLITLSSKEYASFIRYHKELRTYITPLYPFYSSIRVIQNKFFSKNK